jgi:hypothetical protein
LLGESRIAWLLSREAWEAGLLSRKSREAWLLAGEAREARLLSRKSWEGLAGIAKHPLIPLLELLQGREHSL